MPTPLPFIFVRLLVQASDALEYVGVCSLDHLTHEEALVRYVKPDNYESEVNNGRLYRQGHISPSGCFWSAAPSSLPR